MLLALWLSLASAQEDAETELESLRVLYDALLDQSLGADPATSSRTLQQLTQDLYDPGRGQAMYWAASTEYLYGDREVARQRLRNCIAAGTERDRCVALLGRIAPATELVETVQYLASDASAFMTGQVMTLDGGRSLVDPSSTPAH